MTFSWLNCSILLLLCLCCSTEDIQNSCEPPPRRDREQPTDLPFKESYSHGEVVLFHCRPGYVRNRSIQFCCNNGSWEQVLPAGECRKRPCGHPGDLQYGSFELIYEENFVFGARVVYQCNEGYQMVSKENYRDCLTSGWSNSVPHCEEITCHLESIEHGRIIAPKAVYKNGDRIQFSCDHGYKASLWSHATCYESGWSTTPKCIEMSHTCEKIALLNGFFDKGKNRFDFNEKTTYSCQNGFTTQEGYQNGETQCLAGGWRPEPRCFRNINAPDSGASPTTPPALILEAILFNLLGNWILLFLTSFCDFLTVWDPM